MNKLRALALYGFVSGILILSACSTFRNASPGPQSLLVTPAQSCDACAQATVAAALTQESAYAAGQAVATAEIVRANAQAALNSANATLSAVQTQDQNSANVIAAQIAASAEIVRANALATVNSAGSTQSAALTQDAIRQTQMADLATTGAQAIVNQQFSDDLAAATQTAVADHIATQTRAAAATSQWYAEQSRQRNEQRQGPLAFLWMWCLPVFLLLFGGLVLWGVWRWLKIQQANQRILERHVDRLPAGVPHHHHDDPHPHIESDVVDASFQPIESDHQVSDWLDQVKRDLRKNDEKDENDKSDE